VQERLFVKNIVQKRLFVQNIREYTLYASSMTSCAQGSPKNRSPDSLINRNRAC
jgi:hypothetical protein